MSAPHSRSSLRQLGVPAANAPDVGLQVSLVRQFIEIGEQVRHDPTRFTSALRETASRFGTIALADGFVFAARVQRGAKVTEVVNTPDGEVRLPGTTHDTGWVIGERIVPVDPSGAVFEGRGSLKAQFGSAVLDVVRLTPGGTVGTQTRVHLDATSFDSLRVVRVSDILDASSSVHPLSKPATDDRRPSYAA